jgi:hypothetical protein
VLTHRSMTSPGALQSSMNGKTTSIFLQEATLLQRKTSGSPSEKRDAVRSLSNSICDGMSLTFHCLHHEFCCQTVKLIERQHSVIGEDESNNVSPHTGSLGVWRPANSGVLSHVNGLNNKCLEERRSLKLFPLRD